MADRECASCGRPLEADAKPRARMCRRDDCRRERGREKVRRHRARRGSEVIEFPGASAPVGSLADAVRQALGDVNQLESWEGCSALMLAERIDATERETGAGYAALVAKLETSMALALRPRPGESFVDDLRRRRAERLGG